MQLYQGHPMAIVSVDLSLLDNPIYSALGADQSGIAVISGQARRFPGYIGPLAGIPEQTAQSYADLRILALDGQPVALFLTDPPRIPSEWTMVRGALMDQMVCLQPSGNPQHPLQGASMRQLTPDDAPKMVALASLTEPGPFHLRTIELGTFYGIFHGSSLVAMAGQRLTPPGFVEVSAVCTHPDARGRGYAPLLMSTVMDEIFARGKTPMLHSLTSNEAAIAIYRRLGFSFRRNLNLAILALQP